MLLLFGIIPCAHSQWQNGLWTENQAYNWCFGNQAGMEFSSGSPLPLSGVQLDNLEGSVSMSDSNGQLLFYVGNPGFGRNCVIWNKNHVIMPNGTGLLVDESSTQFGVAVPKPNDPDIYYLFTVNSINGLLYNEVDMSMDAGNGDITANKNIVLQGTAKVEKITAVHHANGVDVWVISHIGGTNEFVAYLVTEAGISPAPVISATGLVYSTGADAVDYRAGQLKASPDGSKLASIQMGSVNGEPGIQLFDFNNETGIISNPMYMDGFTGDLFNPFYGLEFSPNSRYLYIPHFNSFFTPEAKVLQFDLQAGDIEAIQNSVTVIATFIEPDGALVVTARGMQLAPDGKIYYTSSISYGGGNIVFSMNVIDYPNNPGVAAGSNPIDLDGEGELQDGVPTFIQSYFASGIVYEGGECPGEEVVFSTLRIAGIESIVWDFGDPDSGADNTSTALEPSHAFSAGGTYTVTATITSNGAQQTATTEVIVLPAPGAVVPAAEALSKCADASGNATFNLFELDATILNGQSSDEYAVTYYASAEDLEAGTAIGNPTNFTTSGQTIYAVVTNTTIEEGAPSCPTTIQFDVVVLAQPSFPGISTFQGCSPFDLVSIVGAPGADTTYSFHASEGEALENTGALSSPEEYVLPGNAGSIYIRATGATGCVQVGELLLEAGNCMIPRGISPNGDGDNDSFDLSGLEVRMLSIYNRYGTKVYSRMDYTDQWSGQSDNGHELPTGTYFYVAEAGQEGNKTGWVYINR